MNNLRQSDTSVVLVKSATLIISFEKPSDNFNYHVKVAQKVTNGEHIILDDTDIISDYEDYTVNIKFDVSHAVQAWIEAPDTNLGLVVLVKDAELSESYEPAQFVMVSEPELVIETRHTSTPMMTRHKRSALDLVSDFLEYPHVAGPTDCNDKDDKNKTDSNHGKQKKGGKCCRY